MLEEARRKVLTVDGKVLTSNIVSMLNPGICKSKDDTLKWLNRGKRTAVLAVHKKEKRDL